jgi:hypothetical protein
METIFRSMDKGIYYCFNFVKYRPTPYKNVSTETCLSLLDPYLKNSIHFCTISRFWKHPKSSIREYRPAEKLHLTHTNQNQICLRAFDVDPLNTKLQQPPFGRRTRPYHKPFVSSTASKQCSIKRNGKISFFSQSTHPISMKYNNGLSSLYKVTQNFAKKERI